MASKHSLIHQETSDKVKDHYEAHSASSYEAAYFYSEKDYTKYLVKLVKDTLHLYPSTSASSNARLLFDIGGGTGNFTKAIIQDTNVNAVVVEPFLPPQTELLSTDSISVSTGGRINFFQKSAEDFRITNTQLADDEAKTSDRDSWRNGYHQVLMKEVVHHLDESNRVDIFKGIRAGYSQNDDVYGMDTDNAPPNLLIVTRPQREIDYPLWKEAVEVWAQNQPAAKDIINDLEDAGFVNVKQTINAHPCEISLKRWQDMIQQRFWSTFNNFSDDELNEACKEIEADSQLFNNSSKSTKRPQRLDEQGNLHFEDRLIFITGTAR